MQCYYHRNSIKKSAKQPFILFKDNLSKSTKDILVQLHSDREKFLKLFQESSREKMYQTSEELNKTINNYLSMFRGFVISPLHDLGGISETVTQIMPSPLRQMYTFSWSDSVAEINLDIKGDAFVEVSSVMFNYGLWYMKWSALMPAKGIKKAASNYSKSAGSHTTVLFLQRAAGLFHWVNDNLSQFNIMQDTKIFGTDLDPDVARTYEHQCIGEANEFVFLSLMLEHNTQSIKSKKRKNSEKLHQKEDSQNDYSLELIRLARCIQWQFQKSENAIRTIADKKFKKWHTYFLMKMALYDAWENVLILKEHYRTDKVVVLDLDRQRLDVRILWQKYENLCHMIQRLCIKYNNYGKELGKENPNSWVYRMVDTKKFLNNIITFVNRMRNDILENKPKPALKLATRIARVKRFETLVKPEMFQLPKLNDNWTVNVCLEFGVQLFLPNFDPTSATNITIKVNDYMPIWIKRFVSLKRTTDELKNFEKALAEKHPQLRLACTRLLQLRKEFQLLIISEISLDSENIMKAKCELLDKFNTYISWLLGLTSNNYARTMFGYNWTSSFNQDSFRSFRNVEYEICCNVFNVALWLMKSVAELIVNSSKINQDQKSSISGKGKQNGNGLAIETRFKNQDLEFAILSLREASGMFQFLLDRARASNMAKNDQDLSEPILRSFRNHCLAEAQELFFLSSNINWIQMKLCIRIMQLYWTASEELQSVEISQEPEEISAKLRWQTYCQIKSYLYKTFGYFYLSEMFPKSGERTIAALQKSQTLLNFLKKQIVENHEIQDNQWILNDSKFKKFERCLDERFQLMCMFFQLNNFDNYAKKYDVSLETCVITRKFDSIIYLTPTKFNLPPMDDYWIENPTIQNILNFDLKPTSEKSSSITESQMSGEPKIKIKIRLNSKTADKSTTGSKKKSSTHSPKKRSIRKKGNIESKFRPSAIIKPLFKATLKKYPSANESTKSESKK